MTRDRGGGHEGGTRSRGASRGSPECRLKQRWCSETETGPLVEENRGERERRVPTRAAREFFLSITKRNSPARSPRSLSPASVAQMSPLCPPCRSADHTLGFSYFNVLPPRFVQMTNSRLVGRSDSAVIADRDAISAHSKVRAR